ncbi:snake venom 5'-nucleotidase-like [Haliotis rubra]|uniref:snake venom 5'-nucleotidase-like n=1 Tax=Haliotis rubra TaxID=36100 RepID=UPI001EE542B9|nr:snake venom 5'-nucleotidase-like [Haliotis rubra]
MTRSLCLLSLYVVSLSVVVGFNLTILHTNDIHARFEQTNKYSGQCGVDDVAEGKCFGGTARLVTKVREQRSLHPNTILLSAGDEFSGTLWFYKYRGVVVARFMNLLQYDVMTAFVGEHPSNEKPVGEYPHVVTQSGGAKVLVVQDYAYGKYLGDLQVTFDPDGVITSWGGNPILLDNNTAQDEATLELMQPYKDGVANESGTVVARSQVLLEGDRTFCRVEECNLGNLIADGMVHQNLKHSDSMEWNHVAIAFMNGGGIRASIQRGDVTIGDILTVLPFRNTVDIVELLGRHVRETLEFAASKWTETGNLFGGFIQVSGMTIVYDMAMPVGQRVIEVKVRCTNCSVPQYVDLNDSEIYKIIMPSFIANGGDGYDVINKNKIKHHLLGDVDGDVFIEYAKSFSPLTAGLDGRITLRKEPTCPCSEINDVTRPSPQLLTSTVAVMMIALLI